MRPRTACCFGATSLSLFDAGYVTIMPTVNFEVSRRIKKEFENGRRYYELHGRTIVVPDDPRSCLGRGLTCPKARACLESATSAAFSDSWTFLLESINPTTGRIAESGQL